jgi:hypothetical protein
MTIIRNKFRTKCAGTLRVILPGELILLDAGKAYCIHSKEYQQFKQDQDNEARSVRDYINAQAEAELYRNGFKTYYKRF